MIDESAIDTEIADALEPPVQEKKIPESRVTELVKMAKLRGRDSMKEEMEKLQQENEALKASQSSMGGVSQPAPIDMEALEANIMQKLQAQQEEASYKKNLQGTVDSFFNKVKEGSGMYPDYDEVVAKFNPAKFPHVALLAAQAPNTAGIIYELAKNSRNLATMSTLAKDDPELALSDMLELSKSIEDNLKAAALEKKNASAPLDRMQSSPVGSGGERLGLKDFKKMFRG